MVPDSHPIPVCWRLRFGAGLHVAGYIPAAPPDFVLAGLALGFQERHSPADAATAVLEAGMRHSGVSPLCLCGIVPPHSCEASSPCCAVPPRVTAPLLVFLPVASFTQ